MFLHLNYLRIVRTWDWDRVIGLLTLFIINHYNVISNAQSARI